MVDESHRHAALTSSENFEIGSNSGWVENYYSERTRRKSASDAALLKSRSKEFDRPFMSTPIKSEGRRGGGGGKKKHISSSRLDFMSDRPQGIPEEEGGGGGGDRGEGDGSGDSLSGSASTSTVIGSSSASSSVASGSPKKSESNPSACITTRSST